MPTARRTWRVWLPLAVLLAFAGVYRLWLHHARNDLSRAMDRLRRKGEPVTADDLVRPAVPDADNAAGDLKAAAALIDQQAEAWKAYRVVDLKWPLTDGAKQAVRAVLAPEASGRALALVRAARAKPGADWQVRMHSPLVTFQTPQATAQFYVSDLCRAAAIDALDRGDHAAFVESVRDALGVSRAAGDHPALAGHFASTVATATANDLVELALPDLRVSRAPGAATAEKPATSQQVRELIDDLLDERRHRDSLCGALRDERVMALDTALAVAEGRMTLSGVAAAYGARTDDQPLALKPTVLADAKFVLDYTTALLKAAEECADCPSFLRRVPLYPLPQDVPGPAGPSRRTHALARLVVRSAEQALVIHFRLVAERRMAAATLAMKAYQLDHHGRLPNSLAELVPQYLPSVPLDPYSADAAPIGNIPDPQRPRVYCVGQDGRDDGGSEAPVNPVLKSSLRWDHRDAVFPLARE